MRVLDVMHRAALPIETGGAVRVFNLLRHLSRRHEIRQFSIGTGRLLPPRASRKEVPVTPTFRTITYTSPATELVVGGLDRLWGSRGFGSAGALRLTRPGRLDELLSWADVVLVEAPWQFAYCAARRPDARLVLSTHNVEAARFESYAELQGRRARDARRLAHVERVESQALARASLVLAVSEADRLELADRYGLDAARIVVVPSGADTERYHPVDEARKAELKRELGLPPRPTVAFVGSRFLGNRAGLAWVRRLAAASDRFTFLVVGAVARPERRGSFHATGRVADVAPYLQASDLAICPIQYGGGTKIKLFESLAAGLPTVAFAESLHGTELVDGEHVLVAGKSEPELLGALERLADEPALAGRVGASGRAFVLERHDWRLSAGVLEAALLDLVGARERRETYRSPATPEGRAVA